MFILFLKLELHIHYATSLCSSNVTYYRQAYMLACAYIKLALVEIQGSYLGNYETGCTVSDFLKHTPT